MALPLAFFPTFSGSSRVSLGSQVFVTTSLYSYHVLYATSASFSLHRSPCLLVTMHVKQWRVFRNNFENLAVKDDPRYDWLGLCMASIGLES